MEMKIQSQQLNDEVSFKLYTFNRLVQQAYHDYLAPLNLTYTQYLVMKILLEEDEIPVNVISTRLSLDSNTVTPLLQRMEKQGVIMRKKRCADQRQRIIMLTAQGRDMREEIECVSAHVANSLLAMDMSCHEANILGELLSKFIHKIKSST